MSQQIKEISIKDLVLWTENPRDPMNEKATDQEIVDKAFENNKAKWNLSKLAKQMGARYDFSELPTVVYHGKKPIVYDGNRRVVLGKVKLGLVTIPKEIKYDLPSYPDSIPCNVCSKKIALEHVLRKHGNSGNWSQLDQDIFLHKFMGQEKSTFLILEEDTGVISNNPKLNQRFVKEEIFKNETLNALGFSVQNGSLHTVHTNEEGYEILNDIAKKVTENVISTRKSRGKVIEILEPSNQKKISQNKVKKSHLSEISFRSDEDVESKDQRQTARTRKKKTEIFGGKLFLTLGETSNIYRDIEDLYKFYITRKDSLSDSFPGIIRMALRLLCESAAKDRNAQFGNYLKKYFPQAKKNLDKDIRTTLSNQNVTEDSIVQLLQTGAHKYQSSANFDQTIAMSIIIGEILAITHSKDKSDE